MSEGGTPPVDQQMGHGVNQRAQITMTDEEIDAFLHERRPMTMCTINHDGSIHAVAMWYGFVDGTVAIETKAKAQKAVNLGRDSRITLLFEDGDSYEELRGVELVGHAEILEDPDKIWELGVNLFERYNGPYSEELRPFVEIMLNKRIVAKIIVERTVSWDHRKLGLPSAADLTAVGATADAPGWYCYSAQPRSAEWDGTAWSGPTGDLAAGPELPRHPPAFAFVGQRWFRWMVAGQILVVVPAIISGTTGHSLWSLLSVLGYAAFLGGAVLAVTRYLHLDRIDRIHGLTRIGIGSGLVAFGVSVGLEIACGHAFGDAATLWLAGPIEEGGKLLVPFVLLVAGGRRFAEPRVGLYLVLVSGATVGVLEGVEYQVHTTFAWAHLQMALIRPSAELLHVFLTGFAAAVIWLAAWRRGRAVTGSGVGAFSIAVAIHSVHDGIATFSHISQQAYQSSLAQTAAQAIGKGLPPGLFALVIGGLLYLMARTGARELTAPSDIAGCPPPFRPQLRQWGCPPTHDAPVWPPGAYAGAYAGGYGYGTTSAAYTGGYAGGYDPYGYPVVPASGLPTVPSAPPGWYTVGGDPGLQGWWSGSSWTAYVRWNGFGWQSG